MTTENNNDCYAAFERPFMVWWQNIREKSLKPVLQGLDRMGVSPNGVTLASLVFGAFAAGTFLVSKPVALTLLFLHVLLDGLDGPLARYQSSASPKGSFTDTMVDQTVITLVMLVLMNIGTVSISAGGFCIFVYTLVVFFAMIRNRLEIPYSWLFRPRFMLYSWLLLEFTFLPGTMTYIVWLLNLVLAAHAVNGFFKIRNEL